jgi:hypothetical protein
MVKDSLTDDPATWNEAVIKMGERYRRLVTISDFTKSLDKYYQMLAREPQGRDIVWTFKGKHPVKIPREIALNAATMWHDVKRSTGDKRTDFLNKFNNYWNSVVFLIIKDSYEKADKLEYNLDGVK